MKMPNVNELGQIVPNRCASTDPAVVGLLQELIEAANFRGAVTVRLEATNQHVNIIYCIDALAGDRDRGSSSLPRQFFDALAEQLQVRSFPWPDFEQNPYLSLNKGGARRLFFSAPGHNPVTVEHTLERFSNDNSTITLTLKGNSDLPNVLRVLDITASEKSHLERIALTKAGLLLANISPSPADFDARAALLALTPRALYYPQLKSSAQAAEALSLSLDNLVVVGLDAQDPVELYFAFRSLITNNQELQDKAARQLRAAFVHRRVKRICASCARQAHIDPQTLQRLPEFLRPEADKSQYMFGRGCPHCGHSSYRGTVGLNSLLYADERVRASLNNSTTDLAIASAAYLSGTRTLLEDGLRKIFSHLTSFESVLGAAPNITQAFYSAISQWQSNAVTNAALNQVTHPNGHDIDNPKEKKQILIIEDDREQRNVLQVLFENSGYQVSLAENGKDAIDKLQRQKADLVICDFMMPVMNGAEFVKRIKADKDLNSVPVLMLTAISDEEAECKLLENGADDYCEKRVKRKVLLKRVEKLLEKQ